MSGAGILRALVVVPVYNHGKTLRAVVEGCLREGHPVLVVDDGSTDGGLATVADLPILRHRLEVNQGKGEAILAAAAIARQDGFEAIVTLDADGQHDPVDARALLEDATGAWPCLVIGNRRMDSDTVPTSSLFGRAFSNFWVRLECGKTLPDTQSGFRIYPVEFLVATRFLSRRYTFEIEAIVRGSWAGLEVLSTPISVYYPPGRERISHFRGFRDNARLSALHTWLVTRSLIPWPHRRSFTRPEAGVAPSSLWHPVKFFRRLSLEHTGPAELAAAVWVGIFIGSLPIIPFGIAAILYVCHRLNLNKLAGAGASNLCVVPFVPFLCIELGHRLIHGTWWTTFTRQALVNEIHLRLGEWLLGALLLGPVLGGLGALATWALVRKLRQAKVIRLVS